MAAGDSANQACKAYLNAVRAIRATSQHTGEAPTSCGPTVKHGATSQTTFGTLRSEITPSYRSGCPIASATSSRPTTGGHSCCCVGGSQLSVRLRLLATLSTRRPLRTRCRRDGHSSTKDRRKPGTPDKG